MQKPLKFKKKKIIHFAIIVKLLIWAKFKRLFHILSSPCRDPFPGDVDLWQHVPHWFPSINGGKGGLARRGVKRKRRPLSRHKYHNSILNNASLLGRGLTHTHTGTYRRHKGKEKQAHKLSSSTLHCHKYKSEAVVQLSKCSFVMYLIYYETKAASYNREPSREGVNCAFVSSWSLVPSTPPLLTVVCVRLCMDVRMGSGRNHRGFLELCVPGENLL